MTKKTMKLALAAVAVLGAGAATAQEVNDPATEAALAAVKTVEAAAEKIPDSVVQKVAEEELAKLPVSNQEEMSKDAGVKAVITMQDNREMPPKNELENPGFSAEEKVRAILKKNNIIEGRTDNAYVQIIDVYMEMEEDPAKDENFFVDRDLLAKQAMLMMKGAIVEGLGTALNASEQFEIFGKTNAIMKTETGATSSAPLFGVTALAQAESYDRSTKQYHMALAAVWSKKLHESAMATLLGKQGYCKPDEKRQSVTEWIEGLIADGSLPMMCGPRQIIDKKGNRVFLGISAGEVGVDSLSDQANKQMAKSSAMTTVAFSMKADVDQYVADNRRQQTMKDKVTGKNKRNTDVNFYKRFSQSLGDEESGRPFVLSGANEVYGKTIKHPMTGRDIYVSVYAADVEASAKASVLRKKLVADNVLAILENNRRLGEIEEAKRIAREANNDNASVAEGAARFRDGVNAEINAGKNQNYSPIRKSTPGQKVDRKAREGVFSGEQRIETDF